MIIKNYRPDIDGIRAISIFLVILFHSKFLNNGYMGVDIFFVLSGYLITNIILQDKKFNLISFYERRARRLLPVLFVGIFVAIILSFFFLFPSELRDFGQSLISTTLFFSNFLFLNESGYFDNASELKPLLHTWSLSVEHQFYLAYPLLFIFLKKIKLINILIAIILISFSLKLFLFLNYDTLFNIDVANVNFYFTFFRFWELGIGCLIATIKLNSKFVFSKLINVFLSYLSIFLLIFIIFFGNNSNYIINEFSILVICFAISYFLYNEEHIFKNLLNNKILVYFGKLSYSLYIWHFIFFAVYRNYSINIVNTKEYLILIIVSFIFSFFSYHFIEKPFRNRNIITLNLFKIFLIFSVSFSILFGLFIHFKEGFPKRFSLEVNKIYNGKLSRNFFEDQCMNKNFKDSCKIGSVIPKNRIDTALWGDSTMRMMLPSFDKLFKEKFISASVLNNCSDIIFDRTKWTKNCEKYYNQIIENIIKNKDIKNIFISHRWKSNIAKTSILINSDKTLKEADDQDLKMNSALELINYLLNNDKKVFIFYPFPEAKYNVPLTKSKLVHQGKSLEIGQTISEYYKRNDIIFKYLDKISHQNLIRIYPHEFFCDTFKKNQCVVEVNNTSVYSDDNHFTAEAVEIFFKKIQYLFYL